MDLRERSSEQKVRARSSDYGCQSKELVQSKKFGARSSEQEVQTKKSEQGVQSASFCAPLLAVLCKDSIAIFQFH